MTKRRDVLKGIGSGAAVIAMGGVASADDDGDDDEGDGEAKVRVAHASPDAPDVDVYVGTDPEGNEPTIEELKFTDVTDYLEIEAGEYDVTITVNEDDDPVEPTPVTLKLDAEDYTVAAIGNLDPEEEEPGFDVDVFQDKLGVLDDGEGRVRAYHASPDAPAVDVAVADEDDEPDIFLAEGLTFGNAGPNNEVDAGEYPVAVYPAGDSEPVFGPIDVEVRNGEVLTAFAEGELDPEDGDDGPGEEGGFGLVPAYEEAAPFGEGRDDDDDEEDEDDDGNGDDNGRGRGRGNE